MRLYLEMAKEQMPNFPASVQDWEMLWRNPLPYKYPEDTDTLFDLLLKAGLCDKHT